MLKDEDLLTLGFKKISPSNYNEGTDCFIKTIVISTSQLEEARFFLKENPSEKLEFCSYYNILPLRGYNISDGIIIKKSGTPNIYGGSTVFSGKINNIDELKTLFKQIGIDDNRKED
jgi:hypothetical protein